jgi:hypothetical protein
VWETAHDAITPFRPRPRSLTVAVVLSALAATVAVGLAPRAVAAQDFYPRGDADCSLTVSAVDMVAEVRAFGNTSTCGNDDCDRDGALTPADATCVASCLFDECPIPANGPRVASAAADSAPNIVPYSAIQLTGNFGSADRLKRVTIGGLDAQVVAFDSPNTLEVIVPGDVPPGPATVVVFDGDIAGPASTITVAAAVPIGQPDTLDGTFDLLDTAVSLMLALDLNSIFGSDAGTLRDSLQSFRTDFAAQRAALAADPNLTAAVRAHLDAAVDGSGAPEMLRALISELESLLVSRAPRGFRPLLNPTVAIAAIARGARTIRIVGAVATAATAPISLPAAAGIALLLGIATGVMIHFASMPMAPVIASLVAFTDVNQNVLGFPVPGGFVRILADHVSPATTALLIVEPRGVRTVQATSFADNTFLFPLPDPPTGDFCGRVQFQLFDTSTQLGSPGIETNVLPVLLGISPSSEGYIGQRLDLDTHGVLGCLDRATAEFTSVSIQSTYYEAVLGDGGAHLPVPDIHPDAYSVAVSVASLFSIGHQGPLAIRDLLPPTIACHATTFAVPPTDPSVPPTDPTSTNCTVRPQPNNVFFPPGASVRWQSSDPNVGVVRPASVDARSPAGPGTEFEAFRPGTTTVTATYLHKDTMETSVTGITMTVTDESPPQLMLTSNPPAGMVDLGATITVTATAYDNVATGHIDAMAAGDAVVGDASQTFTCALTDPDCQTDFTFTLKSSDVMDPHVTITVTATDRAGLVTTAAPLAFTISKDTACPVVTITSPADGSTVNAGSTVGVTAQATDNQTDDTGVKRFHYTATGDALVAPVDQEIVFPKALPTATLNFNFAVKKAGDLLSTTDRTIIVTVEAIDDVGNTCLAQTLTLTAAVMAEPCSGGISVDTASGCDGTPFTITVVITGAQAAQVARVTSSNPDCVGCDLQQQADGTYQITLFYQGEGAFTLDFTALAADGTALCSNSIDLDATGLCPASGARKDADGQVAGAVAGAAPLPH